MTKSKKIVRLSYIASYIPESIYIMLCNYVSLAIGYKTICVARWHTPNNRL